MMPTNFIFVPVDPSYQAVKTKYCRDQVAPAYRSVIRSRSARNPWNRNVTGEDVLCELPARRVSPDRYHLNVAPVPALPPASLQERRYARAGLDGIVKEAQSQPSLSSRPNDAIVLEEEESPQGSLTVFHTRQDPFWTFPIPYQEYMSRILDYSQYFHLLQCHV